MPCVKSGARAGSLYRNLVAHALTLGASGDRAPVRQQPLWTQTSEGNQTSWRDRNDRFHTFKMDAKSEPERACAKRIPADQLLCLIVSFPGLIRTYNPPGLLLFSSPGRGDTRKR